MRKPSFIKLQACLLLLSILLSPVTGLAGMAHEHSTGNASQVESASDQASPCHESQSSVTQNEVSADTSISKGSASDKTGCCDSPCECGHTSCHSSLATSENQIVHFYADSQSYSFAVQVYLNPSIASLTPPPIV